MKRTLCSSEVLSHRVPPMRGMLENPMAEAEIVGRCLGNAEGVLLEGKAAAVVDRLQNLEKEDRINAVYGLLCG